jgi:hypothetical protein
MIWMMFTMNLADLDQKKKASRKDAKVSQRRKEIPYSRSLVMPRNEASQALASMRCFAYHLLHFE